MKAAITEWQGRVAPVFDVAGTVHLFETGPGATEQTVQLPTDNPWNKLAFLKEQGVDVLICGAITHGIRERAGELGIRINPFISGEISEVWNAWESGRLDNACYSMPGCGRCRRRNGPCK